MTKPQHLIPALGLLSRSNRRKERISKIASSLLVFSSHNLVLWGSLVILLFLRSVVPKKVVTC